MIARWFASPRRETEPEGKARERNFVLKLFAFQKGNNDFFELGSAALKERVSIYPKSMANTIS